jgi:membrane protein YqaA with SNARE-associated domain
MKGALWRGGAFAWGFAEATVFFLAPDVLLTYLAMRRGPKTALRAALWASTGAVVGGAVMLAWAQADAAMVDRVLALIPAIDTELIATAKREMAEAWLPALLGGAVTGVPYKLIAVAAGEQGIPAVPFLVASFFARLLRFALVSLLTHGVAALIRRRGWTRHLLQFWSVWWLGFYAVYWSVMPW